MLIRPLLFTLALGAFTQPAAAQTNTGEPQAPKPNGGEPAAQSPAAADDLLSRVPAARRKALQLQVSLDRAGFAPGVIDGQMGENSRNALAAWRSAQSGAADMAALVQADGKPMLTRYKISTQDVAGPFEPIPEPIDYKVLAEREALGFQTPLEAMAERFHTSEAFLKLLNPRVDFGQAGTEVIVPAVGRAALSAKVAKIEVDKRAKQVRAFDGAGKLLAVYPATIGSGALPSPSGTWKVTTVAPRPTYTYDPARLTKNKQGDEKLVLPAGPNNPVGATWIDLSKDTYGIHGTPDPTLIGKRASSGCVRLTNWDAWQLGQSVEAGTVVEFQG